MHKTIFSLLLLSILAMPASAFSNLFRAGTLINDDYNGLEFNLPFNVLTSQLGRSTSGALSESTFAQADLRNGRIRVSNSGSVNSGASLTRFNVTGSALLADTFNAYGPLNGANFLSTLNLTGSYSSSTTGAGTYNNGSFLLISFFSDGFFDNAPGSRILQETFYNIGPGANNFLEPTWIFGGNFATFPARIPISVPFSILGPRFQVRLQLSSSASGDATGGVGGFGSVAWNQDLSNTLVAEFSADNGVTLSTEGGISGTAITPSAVPEPATWTVAAASLGLLLLRRRK